MPAHRRHALIILNPAAGRSRSSRASLRRVVAALERNGCSTVLRQSENAEGDIERLAREAGPEFDVVVAAGGDGTVNAVVNGVAAAQRPVALLPLGTANVLAREIGLPRSPEKLAALIADGPVRAIWPGRIDNRLFVMMAGSGFDAETVAAVNPRLKRYFGRVAFAWAVLGCLLRYRRCELLISADGVEHRAASAIAAKGRCYAGSFIIAPQADLAEPILDLVLFRRSGRLAALHYLASLVRGTLARRSDITMLRTRHARISAICPIPVQADGEIVAHLPVSIGIAAQPLPLVCP